MKKLNITKDKFTESKYFTTKYGNLEYVSESGDTYKTDKGHVLKFKESEDDESEEITAGELIEKLSKFDKGEPVSIERIYSSRYSETYGLQIKGNTIISLTKEYTMPRW